MALQIADRVLETTTTTGTGSYSLGGAMAGYQAFSSALSNGDVCYYCSTDGTNWEVGLGTYTSSGNTLARTTIIASSNSNAAVSWSSGSKNIFLDLAAAMAQILVFGKPRVVTAAGAITVGVTDRIIGVNNNASAAVTVNLLPAAGAGLITIKDMGNAGANNVTLTPNGSDTIDGLSSLVININYGGATLAPISGGWLVIS